MKYGICQKAKNNGIYNGDSYLLLEKELEDLVVIADGLGSGELAFNASQKAMEVVRTYQSIPLQEIIFNCHNGLKGTRGAVMSLCRITKSQNRLSYIGIGNITLQIIETDKIVRPPSMWGMVGHVLTRFKTFDLSYKKGDWAAFYSDSIRPDFDFRPYITQFGDPQSVAEAVLSDLTPVKDDFTLIMINF